MNRYKGGKKGREKIQKKGGGERLRWTHLEISIKIIGGGKKREIKFLNGQLRYLSILK